VGLSLTAHLLAGLAASGAGTVNALAGGGSLISFPSLIGLGVPSVSANVTNTLALCPGYFGGALAQRGDLAGQRRRVKSLLTAAAAGGLVGSVLLVITSDELFRSIVPALLIVACLLLLGQDRLKLWLGRRESAHALGVGIASDGAPSALLLASVFSAAIYGGYFGAGLGIIVLAVLGLLINDELGRLNAVKQMISFAANLAAASLFVFSGDVVWTLALVMAPASLVGGALGGMLAGRLDAARLRTMVAGVGIALALIMVVRG